MVTIRDAFPGFSVDDIAAAREFYGTKLGLPVDDDAMGALRVTLPSSQSVFIYPKPNHEPATYTVLNLVVEDIDRERRMVTVRGIDGDRVILSVPADDPTFHYLSQGDRVVSLYSEGLALSVAKL